MKSLQQRYKHSFWILGIVCLAFTAHAQEDFLDMSIEEEGVHDCGTMHAHNLRLQNSNYAQELEAIEADYQNAMINQTLFPDYYNMIQNIKNLSGDMQVYGLNAPVSFLEDQPLVIPMVFHIFSTDTSPVLTDEEIELNVAWLNQHLANEPGSFYYRADGNNTGIQVALANTDPNGNPTNGINRFNVNESVIGTNGNNFASNTISWDVQQYVNVWVVESISGAAAFAYLPSNFPSFFNGIFIQANYLNAWNENNPNQQTPYQHYSIIMTHELGHFLGLYHTFHNRTFIQGCQGAINPYDCYTQSNNNCLVNGDRICDTPPDAWNGTSCSVLHNTADTDADDTSINNPFNSDVPDIQGNVMDYGSYNCRKQLTSGQVARMNYVLQNQRIALLTSNGLSGVNNPSCVRNAPLIELEEAFETESEGSVMVSAMITNNNQYCGNSIVFFDVDASSDPSVEIVISNEVLNMADGQTIQVPIQINAPENSGIFDAVFVATESTSNLENLHTLSVHVDELIEDSSITSQDAGNNAGVDKDAGNLKASASNNIGDFFGSGGCQSTSSSVLLFILIAVVGLVHRLKNSLFY